MCILYIVKKTGESLHWDEVKYIPIGKEKEFERYPYKGTIKYGYILKDMGTASKETAQDNSKSNLPFWLVQNTIDKQFLDNAEISYRSYHGATLVSDIKAILHLQIWYIFPSGTSKRSQDEIVKDLKVFNSVTYQDNGKSRRPRYWIYQRTLDNYRPKSLMYYGNGLDTVISHISRVYILDKHDLAIVKEWNTKLLIYSKTTGQYNKPVIIVRQL